MKDISNYFDQIFTVFFILETVLKIIALGLILENGSYLIDTWSWLH